MVSSASRASPSIRVWLAASSGDVLDNTCCRLPCPAGLCGCLRPGCGRRCRARLPMSETLSPACDNTCCRLPNRRPQPGSDGHRGLSGVPVWLLIAELPSMRSRPPAAPPAARLPGGRAAFGRSRPTPRHGSKPQSASIAGAFTFGAAGQRRGCSCRRSITAPSPAAVVIHAARSVSPSRKAARSARVASSACINQSWITDRTRARSSASTGSNTTAVSRIGSSSAGRRPVTGQVPRSVPVIRWVGGSLLLFLGPKKQTTAAATPSTKSHQQRRQEEEDR